MRRLGRDAAPYALGIDEAHADERARDCLERLEEMRLGLSRYVEPVDDQPEEHRARQRPEERADDPAPEAVREPDGEVPEREAHHDPGQCGHQRFLPWRRLRGRRCLGRFLPRGPMIPGSRRPATAAWASWST